MAATVTKPAGEPRADDARALRLRIRSIALTGNYATGGETITAGQVGLKRITFVTPTNVLIGGVAGTLCSISIAADRQSFTIKQSEDAAGAAGTPVGQEKTNAEAYVANSVVDVLIIGS
jgi:hypothetical protein